MISRAMWCNKALVNFPKTANCICPTAREFLLSLKNLLMLTNTKLQSKSCHYLYKLQV